MSMAAPALGADSRRQVISFVLEPELLGFELSYVDKVLDAGMMSFVPRAPSFVRGAIFHRGRVMAVIDLRAFFGMEPRPSGLDTKVLIIDHQVYHLGLMVDRVERIESVPVRGPLVSTPGPGETNPYVSRIVNLGGRILNLVDLEKLLAEIENFFA